jgi:hypothetical protein
MNLRSMEINTACGYGVYARRFVRPSLVEITNVVALAQIQYSTRSCLFSAKDTNISMRLSARRSVL